MRPMPGTVGLISSISKVHEVVGFSIVGSFINVVFSFVSLSFQLALKYCICNKYLYVWLFFLWFIASFLTCGVFL